MVIGKQNLDTVKARLCREAGIRVGLRTTLTQDNHGQLPQLLTLMAGAQFDTLYHEHYSYLSLTAVQALCARNGHALFDVGCRNDLAIHRCRGAIHIGLGVAVKLDIARDVEAARGVRRHDGAGRARKGAQRHRLKKGDPRGGAVRRAGAAQVAVRQRPQPTTTSST